MTPEITGWIGNACIMWGLLFLIYKNRIGFIFHIAGNILYISYGLDKDIWCIVFLNVLFIFMNSSGYIKWREDAEIGD
jgi:hypothetical protein